MPKSKPSLTIKLNLLKPQSSSEKIYLKFVNWLLSSGRYIFVLVNALVLIAFMARFKFDADLASKKEAIAQQIPYIESLQPYELLIRETQLKLTTIDNIKRNSFDWQDILKRISSQIPVSITITNLNMEVTTGTATVHVSGQTKINNDVTSLVNGIKSDNTFSNINLTNIGLEQDLIKFDLSFSARPGGERSV